MDPQTSTPAQPDVFSQLATQQPNPAPSNPSVSNTPSPTPSQQQGSGDVFDQLAAGTISPTGTQTTPTGPDSLDIQSDAGITDTDGPLSRIGKGARDFAKRTNAVGAGIGDSLLSTINGGASLLHLPHSTLQARQKQLEQDNSANPDLNAVGYGGETLMEFLAGDGALKGLALSDRLLKSAAIAKALEASPNVMKALQIGAQAMRSGTVQGAASYVRTGGDGKEALGEGTVAGALTGALGVGGETLQAIRTALDDSGVQPALQSHIRAVLSDAAKKAGVSEPTAASIRDAAQQVSDGLKAKAQSMYETLDRISGGQAQRFRDAANNVSDELRSIVGLDDDREAALLAKQAKIEAAHKAMLADLAAKGHDPNMLSQADAVWKQQSALSDLSNSIRQSTTGLRPELAKTATGATTPEAVNSKTLFTRLNRLNDRGRLAQAIGQDNANALMQHVDAAYVQASKFADRQAFASKLAKAGLSATGLGLLGAGYEGAKHLLGVQ